MDNQVDLLQTPEIFIPTTLDEVISLKKQFGTDFTYVAGATLLQLHWQIAHEIPKRLIHLEQISSLQQCELDETHLTIGAHTKLSDLRFNANLKQVCPVIPYAVKSIAAPAVRNRGTVGGNVMGGEGDLIPLFLVMQAEMLFLTEEGYQTVPILEWLPARQTVSNLLINIKVPLKTTSNTHTFYKKIGRRETFTAAIVTVAGQVTFTEDQTIEAVTLAIGGGGNNPLRLLESEKYLKGKALDVVDWKLLYRDILNQYSPVTDAFVTGRYKQKVAANLLISALQNLFTTELNREVSV